MKHTILDRRRFLRRGGEAAAAVATVVAVSGTTMIVASNNAWAVAADPMTPHEAKTLLRMARVLYPHDFLADVHYATVVEALGTDAKKDPDQLSAIKDGIPELDGSGRWLDLGEEEQVAALTRIETTPFFQSVRSKTVTTLYNQPSVWRMFGYEGSSFDEGGYLYRGFDDLAWLPRPPEEASPRFEEG